MSIALGTYIVFARSPQSPAKNTESNVTAARRPVGLVVDVHGHPNTSNLELSVQTISRAGAAAPAHLPFAMPIAGPAGSSIGTDTNSDDEAASILRVEPEGQPFPWDGCVQWTSREHAALLRVVLQHDDHASGKTSRASDDKLSIITGIIGLSQIA